LDDEDLTDEDTVLFADLARPGAGIHYTYDFGDNWRHVITVEEITEPEPGVRYPRCLAGERACPPEDVGGEPGYEYFLDAINNPAHPEHAHYIEWGGSFDPAVFDLAATNTALTRHSWRDPDTLSDWPVPTRQPAEGVTLRCTGKLLTLMRVPKKDLADVEPSGDDWYANLIWIDGRKCLLAVHAATLFAVFIPDVRAADVRPITKTFVPAVREALAARTCPRRRSVRWTSTRSGSPRPPTAVCSAASTTWPVCANGRSSATADCPTRTSTTCGISCNAT
jgi:hypothetical protein